MARLSRCLGLPTKMLSLAFAFAFAFASASASAPARPFPFLYDVGGGNASQLQWVHTLVPRVELGKIFECPHPCGLLPSFNPSTGVAVNGGIPQSPDFNMTLHLTTLQMTFDRGSAAHHSKAVPDDDSRYIDLDFESWNPSWAQNSNGSYTRNASIALARRTHPGWTDPAQIEAEAKKQFEAAALKLLVATAQAVRRLRPKLKIGFYSFPTREYWCGCEWRHPSLPITPRHLCCDRLSVAMLTADENATMLKRNDCHPGQGGDALRAENDKLLPLYCEMDGLFPSVYQFYNSEDPTKTPAQQAATKASNAAYVHSMVAEAVRLQKLAGAKCTTRAAAARPVYAYTWHRYHDGVNFLSAGDLVMSFEQAYLAGAAANVMWGSEPKTMAQFKAWYTSTYAPLVNKWVPPAERSV